MSGVSQPNGDLPHTIQDNYLLSSNLGSRMWGKLVEEGKKHPLQLKT